MKYKTKEEKEAMTLDELIAYSKKLDAHGLKWDKVTLFVMGVCLGGGKGGTDCGEPGIAVVGNCPAAGGDRPMVGEP